MAITEDSTGKFPTTPDSFRATLIALWRSKTTTVEDAPIVHRVMGWLIPHPARPNPVRVKEAEAAWTVIDPENSKKFQLEPIAFRNKPTPPRRANQACV